MKKIYLTLIQFLISFKVTTALKRFLRNTQSLQNIVIFIWSFEKIKVLFFKKPSKPCKKQLDTWISYSTFVYFLNLELKWMLQNDIPDELFDWACILQI